MTVNVKLLVDCPNHVHVEATVGAVMRHVVLVRDNFALDLTDIDEVKLRLASAIKATAGAAGATTVAQVLAFFSSGANVEV